MSSSFSYLENSLLLQTTNEFVQMAVTTHVLTLNFTAQLSFVLRASSEVLKQSARTSVARCRAFFHAAVCAVLGAVSSQALKHGVAEDTISYRKLRKCEQFIGISHQSPKNVVLS